VALIAGFLASAKHQFTLRDNSASCGDPIYVSAFGGTHCAYPRRDGIGQDELACVAGHMPRWFIHLWTVTQYPYKH